MLGHAFREKTAMGLKLTTPLRELLTEVINKRCPHLIGLLTHPQDAQLTDSERDVLREAVADEFVETGLREDDEPNKRGLLLEDLIGRLRNP